MEAFKSDLLLANEMERVLQSQCVGLGTGAIEVARASNIDGVADHASIYRNCTSLLSTYKKILDADASRIGIVAETFTDLDQNIASGM
ncbi:MAG: TIGR04197 family type VII secretion effector [Lachnospiraceae bacterium]|jgi:type VII secretion effector (TIGR04197 family)|nr:TIGR04197 family type VII secretion effector [Lachnospiraceae bacterium]